MSLEGPQKFRGDDMKPEKVRKAQGLNYDPDALSKMGKKGGRVTALRRDISEAIKAEHQERRKAQDHQMDLDANYDYLTPDGEAPENLH